eukprot:gb/GEZN01017889.1/.p1 GENE.gb/GEZN01017889.1/~~gb/GEZN01017889.1/.p1  ORF type:complete len:120 (-),score=3.31 gb/GEZN01017889.1/:368-727(-)
MLQYSIAAGWLLSSSAVVAILAALGDDWKIVFGLVIALWNVVAFLVYWYDKHQAKAGRVPYRTPETVLWLLLWWAGCVGAWCAMSVCHHKTKKSEFRNPAIVLTIFNGLWLCIYILVQF